MGKTPKLQLSFLNSFQMCRPRDPSSLIRNPSPAITYYSSPINSQSFDISLPTFPDPPPSTPNYPPSNRNIASSKITPLGLTRNSGFSSHEYKEKPHNSKISSDSNGRAESIAASSIEKKKGKTKLEATHKTKTLLADIDETESSCLIIEEEPLIGKQIRARTRRFKRYGSNKLTDGGITAPDTEPGDTMAASGSLVPCMVEGKANQSFVVVKRSVDPYEDFKKSMLEMILEKQMTEPEQLDQLLMNFLSLNSRMHHKVILKAFTDIWTEIFR